MESNEPVIENQLPLFTSLEMIFDKVNAAFGNSKDIVTGIVNIEISGCFRLGFIYTQGLIDAKVVQKLLQETLVTNLRRTMESFNYDPACKLESVRDAMATLGEIKAISDFSALFTSVLSGETVILLDGHATGFAFNSKGGNERSVEEPSTQSVVRGPRDGFTENIGTNIALIRKKIKSTNLWVETSFIGRVTQTQISTMFIKGIVNDKLTEEVRTRLARIDIDGILESGYIEELIQDETYTPFPTLFNSERPDVIAAGLLEGRVAILVDGTPFVLLAPALFVEFFQSAEDYYQRADFATLIRILRYICFFISLMAPSFYIAVTTFHQELLPSQLLFSLAAQREGTPFPAFVEALIMEVTFEILREAGVRLPKTVGQAVSIVGALVIGQAAVEAGLVSPAMVIVVSITAISNFVIPAFNMGISIRILRFMLMVFAASFGLFGITMGLIAIVQHLCSLRSFGVPYMSPMAPFVAADQKDTLLRIPIWGMFSRPHFIGKKTNPIRANNSRPKKPDKDSTEGAQ